MRRSQKLPLTPEVTAPRGTARGTTVAQPWLNPLYLLYSGSRYLLAVTPDSISVEIQEMNRSIDLLTARSLDQPR